MHIYGRMNTWIAMKRNICMDAFQLLCRVASLSAQFLGLCDFSFVL